MLKTFNLGWGFAIIVRKIDAEDAIQLLKGSEVIGTIIDRSLVIKFEGKNALKGQLSWILSFQWNTRKLQSNWLFTNSEQSKNSEKIFFPSSNKLA